MRPLWLGYALLALIPLSCSDDDGDAGSTGQTGAPCERENECDDGDGCTHDFCINGFCQNNQVPNGPEPNAMQTDGDCKVIACRDGVSQVENDDGDEPDDETFDCMVPTCVDGVPQQTEADPGQDCGLGQGMQGVCDGQGTCSCAPPSGDAPVYVDPQDGTDAPTNGGARGECAYATLDYALSQGAGPIVLASGTYGAPQVTFPITLTDNQVLECDTDNDQPTVTITGSGAYGTGTATVVYEGTANGMENCIIDGGGVAESCVVVATAGMGEFDHYFYQSQIVDCAANGIQVLDTGNNVNMGECVIDDNTTAGVLFTGADKIGFLDNNIFEANGTDVVCTDMSPALDGNNNGNPSCTGCQNCPF